MTTSLPANVTIVDLPAGTTVSGIDLFEAVQTINGVGVSVSLSADQIVAYAGTTILSILPAQASHAFLAGPSIGLATASPTFRVILFSDLPQGKCEGRKSYAEIRPETVTLVKQLHALGVPLRKISAELTAQGHLTARGKPYVAAAVQSMLR